MGDPINKEHNELFIYIDPSPFNSRVFAMLNSLVLQAILFYQQIIY